MTGNIQTDAQELKSRLDEDGFIGDDIYLFASHYSGNRELLVDALLLSSRINSNILDVEIKEKGGKLIDKIVLEADTPENKQKLEAIKSIEANAAKRYQKEQKKDSVILEIKDLKKKFTRSGFELKDINLSFKLGEITGIIGPNANGKSTLLKIIVGELLKDEGAILYPEFSQGGEFDSWPRIKHNIAYIPQELEPWRANLYEILLYEASRHGIRGKECEFRAKYIIHRLGLVEYANYSWNQLSGGYKLRFALAKALVWKPSVLILDEPLANLDVSAQLTILRDLSYLAHDLEDPICVILSSQHIHEIEYVADNLLVLDFGKVTYFGKPFSYNIDSEFKMMELSCESNLVKLRKILNIKNIRIEDRGYTYVIKMPKHYSLNAILQLLIAANISIRYFRDITHSVKQMFYGSN